VDQGQASVDALFGDVLLMHAAGYQPGARVCSLNLAGGHGDLGGRLARYPAVEGRSDFCLKNKGRNTADKVPA